MARHATIIASKGGTWESLSVGSPVQLRSEFKHGAFAGFEQVYYLDTSGGTRRKKGKPGAAKPKPKAKKST